MKHRIIFMIICLSVIFISSCKTQYDDAQKARIDTACRFLECLKNDDVSCINNMLGSDIEKALGRTQEILEFDVNKASGILKEYGIPERDSFSYDKYPNHANEYFYINVPVAINHQSNSKILSATIRIGFLRRLGDEKVANYFIDADYKKTMIQPL